MLLRRARDPMFTDRGITWHGLAAIGKLIALCAALALVQLAASYDFGADWNVGLPYSPRVADRPAAIGPTAPESAAVLAAEGIDRSEYYCVLHPC